MSRTQIIAAWDRLLQGDQTVTSTLFEHFYVLLVGSVFLRPGYMPEEDVDDVKRDAVDIVLDTVLGRPELVEFDDADPDSRYRTLKAYLVAAAQNRALTLYKRRVRAFRDRIDAEAHLSSSHQVGVREVEQQVFRNARRDWLYRMITEQLTDAQKIVVIGRLKGLTFRDLADELGLKEKAVQDRYRRALNRLRRLAKRWGRK